MSQEIVVQQRPEKNELEKSILKVRGEEQEEEEEEEEDYDDSLKAKTTVKFVVESDDHSKDFTKLIIESSSKLSPQIESGLNEFFGTKINIQSLEHFKRDGLLENEILTENHQVIVELPQSSSSITVAENNIERTVDRVEERILESEKIIDQQENSEVPTEIVENQIADIILQEAMSKAFQDAAYTSPGEQPPIQRLQQSPELVEHRHGEMGTFYPTAQRPEMRKISSPAQLSPVKVYLHNGTGDQGSGRFDPPNANGHVPRPPWSTTQALTMIPQQVPHQTPPLTVLKGPISHQKLADQVAQKAIENQAQQEQIRQKYKESRVVGVAATPKSTVKESVHYYAPPISRSPQPQEQYVYQQQYTLNQDFPQALNYQRAISPKTPSRDESLERRMKVTKLHDPGSWVVQESVTESQMVKGAPWARYQLEKKERVWPPASPKLVQGSADYAPNYEKQRYETESANPFQRKYPDIYEEQEKKHVLQTSAAPSYQHYGESYNQQQQQTRNSPVVTEQIACREKNASPHMATYENSQRQEPIVRPTFAYTPQPMQKFVCHTQDATIQKYEPVRPMPFKPQWSPAAVRPDLNQPLSLDTTQNTYHQYYHQQQSPRTIYKPQGPYSAVDVTNVVPPSQQHTSTPVLPFTKTPERQDYERFQNQYSPGRLVYQPQRESHQYVTNQVASVPGGTSFARVQNVSSVDIDPTTGQAYKENVQRIVRTTRTIPKTWQN